MFSTLREFPDAPTIRLKKKADEPPTSREPSERVSWQSHTLKPRRLTGVGCFPAENRQPNHRSSLHHVTCRPRPTCQAPIAYQLHHPSFPARSLREIVFGTEPVTIFTAWHPPRRDGRKTIAIQQLSPRKLTELPGDCNRSENSGRHLTPPGESPVHPPDQRSGQNHAVPRIRRSP